MPDVETVASLLSAFADPGGTAYSHDGRLPSTSSTEVLWYSSSWRYFSSMWAVSSRAAEKIVAATASTSPTMAMYQKREIRRRRRRMSMCTTLRRFLRPGYCENGQEAAHD